MRRIYSDEDVVRFAKKLYPMGVFGFECTLDKVIEELKSYNDFSIHRVIFLAFVNDFSYFDVANHMQKIYELLILT